MTEILTPKQKKAKENVEMMLQLLAHQREVDECERSLRAFVRAAWPVVEPGVPYVHGLHIDAICDHLEAVTHGEIRQLIINMPPRHGKSSILAVMWPAWVWITNPEKRWLFASYAENLSIRDSVKCRRLLKSNWYQKNWGDRFKIVSDQNEKRRFENDKTGYRIASSVGGSNTGDGGDVVVYDDPNNIREVESDVVREGVNDWHDQVMTTRLNNPKTGARVVVQQRSHERDMSGHLLEKGGWDHLVLPARFEGEIKTTSIGWADKRTKFGQLLWPEHFGEMELANLERDLGAAGAAGQLQQRPSPGEGGKFKRQYWKYWNREDIAKDPETGRHRPVRVKNPGQEAIERYPETIPQAFEQVIQSWDLAFKDEKENDFVAGHVWGRVGANVYLIDRVKERLDFPRTLSAIREMSNRYPCPEKLIEDKANGPAVIATLRNEIPGIIPITPEGGKISRANAVAPYVESGNVYLPNPSHYPWVLDFIEEAANFPRGKHDDDVDAMTQALRRMFDSVSHSGAPEFRVQPRSGEPDSACHVKGDGELASELGPHWRRWVAVSPGHTGAALWVCETPSGSLRVYRELEISGMDAFEAGRRIAEATVPDVDAYARMAHSAARWNIDVLMEKEAFTPVEPVGSYAELMEQGLLSYDPTEGSWERREIVRSNIKLARFSVQMGELEDASWDRLRDLLRFKPADFQELKYDRKKAIELSRNDLSEYGRYMAQVEGKVYGEYPKIKFSVSCKRTAQAIGSSRRDQDIEDPFMRALLLGISAPRTMISATKPPKPVLMMRRAM